MNAWQLDLVRDQMDTEEWNRLNAPDPNEQQLKNASVSITEAVGHLQYAESRLADAMVELFDTPAEAVVGSFLDQLQDLRIDLKELANKYGKGERE